MITAIDASVLWCLINNEANASRWRAALESASREGDLVICPVAFAEVSPAYSDKADALDDLDRLEIGYDAISPAASWKAGQIYKSYRRAGGPRLHMIPDFLIGAHAQVQADRLAALDRGFLRVYFPKLRLLPPAK